jgi:hypothetical protein
VGRGDWRIQAVPHFGFGEMHFQYEVASKGRKPP